ncbi:hypothetical protein NQ318_010586 [Aromia moschata]|uniref:Uncharacterized protein n=1 Tax=Aromia moschata TaxID=1265417 RepID=A0AAV8XBA5_9CUCU|nr:hypothetical protein NQ318_010586 [Aromia moschata]
MLFYVVILLKKVLMNKNNITNLRTDLSDWYKNNIDEKLVNELFEFQGQSGMTLNRIESLEINMNRYDFGNAGNSFIELPLQIKNIKAVVNVKNTEVLFCLCCY